MENIKLRYGKGELVLTQSKNLIGVRPEAHLEKEARAAVALALEGASWMNKGALGGFDILSVDGEKIDADKVLDKIRVERTIAVGTHVFEAAESSGHFVPTGDLYVQFAPGVSDEERQTAIDQFRLSVKEARPEGFILTITPASPNPLKVAEALQRDSRILIAEPDLASLATLNHPILPTDTLLGEQWHLRNIGKHRGTTLGFLKGADARVLDAWEAIGSFGSSSVIVALIDDGFDLTHPDFALPHKFVHPWDFTRNSDNPEPEEGDWHGTACAGVAVAASGGGNVLGAAPGCTLMPLRWGPYLSDEQIENWFSYVTEKGAWVVSCSWGSRNANFPLSTRAYLAIESCARQGRGGRGCVVVFAAGNENRDINDPQTNSIAGFAIHPDVIAVAASTSRDERSDYSNFGNEICVCAPSSGAGGWGVLTSDVTGSSNGRYFGYSDGDYTNDFGGTSSACPLVSGIAALVLSVNPELTSAEVKELLARTARKIGTVDDYQDGHSSVFGYGCVNALSAVLEVLPPKDQ
jgi:subtilisin family serine protease